MNVNLNKDDVEKFRNLVNSSEKILLINHRRMDGDAYGSLYSFYKALEKSWKTIAATSEDPIPDTYYFLTDERVIDENLDIRAFKPDLIISFDVAGIEQFGARYTDYLDIFLGTPIVCIDHHKTNPGIWNINLIDAGASSTCEITYEIIKEFFSKDIVNRDMATALLMWVITDTNSFFNTNSSPNSLIVASELMTLGARHQDIIINLFKKKSYSKIKLWWKVLEWLKSIKENKIVWNIVPKSYFIETWSSDKDITWLLDEFLSSVNWSLVVFIIYELENWHIKATFRSKENWVDLASFCDSMWWWWHKQAAGFIRTEWNIYEIEQEVINKLSCLV